MSTLHNPSEVSIRLMPVRSKVKSGLTPVYISYRQFGEERRLSLSRKIEIDHWFGEYPQFVDKSHSNAKLINFWLRKKLQEADKILLEAELTEEIISFENFKFKFVKGKNFPILELHEKYVKYKKKQGRKKNTLRNYETRINKLLEYAPDITVKEINEDFLYDYIQYLCDEMGNIESTIYSAVLHIKAMMEYGRNRKILYFNPVENFPLKKGDTFEPVFLTEKEVAKLKSLQSDIFLPRVLLKTLQMFLTACFSGMDFIDCTDFSYKDIQKREDEMLVINRKRKKNDNDYVVPILQELKEVLSTKLVDYENRIDKIFHTTTNQQTNYALKAIAKAAKIDKRLTFHVGRHTFATLFLNRGVRKEVIKKMLGHKTDRQTNHYAKVLEDTVVTEMKATYNKNNKDEKGTEHS